MCHIAIESTFEPSFPVRVCDIDLNSTAFTPTWQLVGKLQERMPDANLLVVIGEDLLNSLHTWAEPERLVQIASFLVIPRLGFDDNTISEEAKNFLATSRLDWIVPHAEVEVDGSEIYHTEKEYATLRLSSSEVRKRLASGHRFAQGLVPRPVLTYIIRNRLYSTN